MKKIHLGLMYNTLIRLTSEVDPFIRIKLGERFRTAFHNVRRFRTAFQNSALDREAFCCASFRHRGDWLLVITHLTFDVIGFTFYGCDHWQYCHNLTFLASRQVYTWSFAPQNHVRSTMCSNEIVCDSLLVL